MARIADPVLAERRRRQIMEAALRCFRRRGFHQSSMQEICAEAGLSAGAVYRYFPSKTDIIAAIAEDDRREVEASLVAAEASGDLVEGFVECMRQHIIEIRAEGTSMVAEVMAESLRDPRLGARLSAVWAPVEARLAAMIASAQRAGQADPDLDPQRAARLIEVAVDGVRLRIAGAEPLDADVLADDFRELLTRLLRPGVGAGCNSAEEPKMKRSRALKETA